MIGHGAKPHVGIEADLMGSMPAEHRPAARLSHVADEDAGQSRRSMDAIGEALHERDQRRMTVVSVARGAHHLPVRAIERQRLRSGDASPGIEAVDVRRACGRLALAAEHLLGRQTRSARIGQRRRRNAIQRPAILRVSARREQGEHGADSEATQHETSLSPATCRAGRCDAMRGRLAGQGVRGCDASAMAGSVDNPSARAHNPSARSTGKARWTTPETVPKALSTRATSIPGRSTRRLT